MRTRRLEFLAALNSFVINDRHARACTYANTESTEMSLTSSKTVYKTYIINRYCNCAVNFFLVESSSPDQCVPY